MPNDASFSGKAPSSRQTLAGCGSPPLAAPVVLAAAAHVASADGSEVAGTSHLRIGMTIFDAPEKALDTICALTGAGLTVEQVGLVALAHVMNRCADISARWSCFTSGAGVLFRHLQELCVLGDGKPLMGTSSSLIEPVKAAFTPFIGTAQAAAASGGAEFRAGAQRREMEMLLRGGAVALVAKASDSRQQQAITRLLLANSQHRVTTYDVPAPAARA